MIVLDLPKIGVVVVHYHRFDDLRRLLATLYEQVVVDTTQVVVCDNGSLEGQMSSLVERWPSLSVISLENVGYGAAANRGVEHLGEDCEFFLIATHELELSEGCLEQLLSSMKTRPDVGLLGPTLLLSGSDSKIWSQGGILTSVRRYPSHLKTDLLNESPYKCDWLDGSAILVRRAAYREIGGFVEPFFLYFEDIELSCAMRSSGWTVGVVPLARAKQSPGGHINHKLAIRNLAWTMLIHDHKVAYGLWMIENLARLLVGTILRPRGSRVRQAQRWKAVCEARRLPESLVQRRETVRSLKGSRTGDGSITTSGGVN